MKIASIFSDITLERRKQDEKFGIRNLQPDQHIHILNEEFCEAQTELARTVNDYVFRPPGHPVTLEHIKKLRAELVQVAAVACHMMETIDRGLASPADAPWAVKDSSIVVCAFCLSEVFQMDCKEVSSPGLVKPAVVCKLHDDRQVIAGLLG